MWVSLVLIDGLFGCEMFYLGSCLDWQVGCCYCLMLLCDIFNLWFCFCLCLLFFGLLVVLLVVVDLCVFFLGCEF